MFDLLVGWLLAGKALEFTSFSILVFVSIIITPHFSRSNL
jgi:hypothetical protein